MIMKKMNLGANIMTWNFAQRIIIWGGGRSLNYEILGKTHVRKALPNPAMQPIDHKAASG